MVHVVDKFCKPCGRETIHFDGECYECARTAARAKEVLWAAMTVDQRLVKLRERVERLEKGPPMF